MGKIPGKCTKIMKNNKGFQCKNCGRLIIISETIGTRHRNHCPFCLYSVDVDLKSGDRKSECRGTMEPIGLTLKHEGKDKYGKERKGELMLVHKCLLCGKISINRIAGDDNPDEIMNIFKKSQKLNSEKKKQLEEEGIDVLSEKDEIEIKTQLFGKSMKI